VNPEKVGNVPRMINGLGSQNPGTEEQVWAATMTKVYEKYGLSSVSKRAAVFERYQLAGQPGLKESCIAKLSAESTKEQQEEREEQAAQTAQAVGAAGGGGAISRGSLLCRVWGESGGSPIDIGLLLCKSQEEPMGAETLLRF
jgi:hypothetical protein